MSTFSLQKPDHEFLTSLKFLIGIFKALHMIIDKLKF